MCPILRLHFVAENLQRESYDGVRSSHVVEVNSQRYRLTSLLAVLNPAELAGEVRNRAALAALGNGIYDSKGILILDARRVPGGVAITRGWDFAHRCPFASSSLSPSGIFTATFAAAPEHAAPVFVSYTIGGVENALYGQPCRQESITAPFGLATLPLFARVALQYDQERYLILGVPESLKVPRTNNLWMIERSGAILWRISLPNGSSASLTCVDLTPDLHLYVTTTKPTVSRLHPADGRQLSVGCSPAEIVRSMSLS